MNRMGIPLNFELPIAIHLSLNALRPPNPKPTQPS
jgi:hypothetical protein